MKEQLPNPIKQTWTVNVISTFPRNPTHLVLNEFSFSLSCSVPLISLTPPLPFQLCESWDASILLLQLNATPRYVVVSLSLSPHTHISCFISFPLLYISIIFFGNLFIKTTNSNWYKNFWINQWKSTEKVKIWTNLMKSSHEIKTFFSFWLLKTRET